MLGVEKYHRLRLGVHRNYSLEITLGVEKYHRLRLGVEKLPAWGSEKITA
jgi:peptidyl-tRNA hydrolase